MDVEHPARLAPPCRVACPADKNVPGFLRAIARGDDAEAWRIAFRDNLFPGVLGWICPRPCEDACRLASDGGAVPVCDLKRWVTSACAPPPDLVSEAVADGPDVAIVGAGPAGLAAAHDLAVAGARVTLFDRDERPGGLLAGCIPSFRLPPAVVDADIRRILSLGIEFRGGFAFRDLEQLTQLRTEGYAAALLAVGAGDDRIPSVRGWRPGAFCRTAIEFLRAVSGGEARLDGRRVAVVGGGNGAVDAARAALRVGAKEVTVLYRRTREEMPAFRREVDAAEAEGVRFRFRTVADAVEWSEHAPGGLRCGDGPFHACDAIIFAIGQERLAPVVHDPAQGIFATAAPQRRAGTVVDAIAAGRRAAAQIVDSLARDDRAPASARRVPEAARVVRAPSGNGHGDEAPALDVCCGMVREMAAREAARCLGCDRLLVLDADACIACGRCVDACVWNALTWRPATQAEWRLGVDDVACRRCGDCIARCPTQALRWMPWRRPNRFRPRAIAIASPAESSSSVSVGAD